MKPRVGKISILLGLVGFMVIGFLLFVGHPGVAIQFSNYLFYWLVIVFIYEKINT